MTAKLVDLSHVIADGTVTYKGLPAPRIHCRQPHFLFPPERMQNRASTFGWLPVCLPLSEQTLREPEFTAR